LSVTDLPAINAALNLTSFILVGVGFYFIKQKNIRAHKAFMIAALVVSGLFLTSYLIYHYNVGSVKFTKQGWLRSVYFPLLLSHTILAVVIVPLVFRTTFLGLKNRVAAHRGIAKWTLPMWMYVSITGVIVYVMLYRLP
jgi:putative membrane protein